MRINFQSVTVTEVAFNVRYTYLQFANRMVNTSITLFDSFTTFLYSFIHTRKNWFHQTGGQVEGYSVQGTLKNCFISAFRGQVGHGELSEECL